MQNPINIFPDRQLIIDWLEDHAQYLNDKDVHTLALVCRHLDYSNASVANRLNGENILVIPLREAVVECFNLNQPFLNLNESVVLNLIIIQSLEGKFRWSTIIAFIPADGEKSSGLSEKTIENIVNERRVEDNGMFKFLALNGMLCFQMEFKNGKMSAWGSLAPGNQLPKRRKRAPQNYDEFANDYYLVTTYHNEDAGKPITEEYLYSAVDVNIFELNYGELEEEMDLEVSITGNFSSRIQIDDQLSDESYEQQKDLVKIKIAFCEVEEEDEELILTTVRAIIERYVVDPSTIHMHMYAKFRLKVHAPLIGNWSPEIFNALTSADLGVIGMDSSGPVNLLKSIQ